MMANKTKQLFFVRKKLWGRSHRIKTFFKKDKRQGCYMPSKKRQGSYMLQKSRRP
jgi:hypothetical protein